MLAALLATAIQQQTPAVDPRASAALAGLAAQVVAVQAVPTGSFAAGPHLTFVLRAHPATPTVCEQEFLTLEAGQGQSFDDISKTPAEIQVQRRFRRRIDVVEERSPSPNSPAACDDTWSGARWVTATNAEIFDEAYRTLRGLQIAWASGQRSFKLSCEYNDVAGPCAPSPFADLMSIVVSVEIEQKDNLQVLRAYGSAPDGRVWTMRVDSENGAPRTVTIFLTPPPLV